MIEPLVVGPIGQEVSAVKVFQPLVELEISVVVEIVSDVWVVEGAPGTAESEHGALLEPKSGCLFESGAVKGTVNGLHVALVIGELFEFVSEADGDAAFQADAGPVDIAESEAVDEAGVDVAAVAAVALGLVVSGYEQHYTLSSETVVACDSQASFGVVVVAVFENEGMMAPCEETQGLLSEVPAGTQLVPTVVEPELLYRPETGKLCLIADGTVEEMDVSVGESLDFVVLVWVPTAVMWTAPGCNHVDKAEAVSVEPSVNA